MSTAVELFDQLEEAYYERVAGLMIVDEPVYELLPEDPYAGVLPSYVPQAEELYPAMPMGVFKLKGDAGVPPHIGRSHR